MAVSELQVQGTPFARNEDGERSVAQLVVSFNSTVTDLKDPRRPVQFCSWNLFFDQNTDNASINTFLGNTFDDQNTDNATIDTSSR
jgi:hypothetical protein